MSQENQEERARRCGFGIFFLGNDHCNELRITTGLVGRRETAMYNGLLLCTYCRR